MPPDRGALLAWAWGSKDSHRCPQGLQRDGLLEVYIKGEVSNPQQGMIYPQRIDLQQGCCHLLLGQGVPKVEQPASASSAVAAPNPLPRLHPVLATETVRPHPARSGGYRWERHPAAVLALSRLHPQTKAGQTVAKCDGAASIAADRAPQIAAKPPGESPGLQDGYPAKFSGKTQTQYRSATREPGLKFRATITYRQQKPML